MPRIVVANFLGLVWPKKKKKSQKMPILTLLASWRKKRSLRTSSSDCPFLSGNCTIFWHLRAVGVPEGSKVSPDPLKVMWEGSALMRPLESQEIVWKWECAIFDCFGLHKSKVFLHNFRRVPEAWHLIKNYMACRLWHTFYRFPITGLGFEDFPCDTPTSSKAPVWKNFKGFSIEW